MNKSVLRPALALSLLVTIGGCVSPERKPAVTAVSSLADTRTELVGGTRDLDTLVAALSELEAQPANLTPPYNRFKDAAASVERRAKTVSTRVQDMQTRSAEYRANWSQENAQITDPSLRATAEQRRERVLSRYDAIHQQAQQVRSAYDPFITRLHDLETVLANDLTYAGVQAAKPAFEQVRNQASALHAQVDALVAQLDDASMQLAPTTRSTR